MRGVVFMLRLMRRLVAASALAAAVFSLALAPGGAASAGTTVGLGHAGKPGRDAPAAIKVKYACTSAYGSVLIKPAQWATGLVSTGHDGANLDVYSNYSSGSCDRPSTQSPNGTDDWGTEYQCAELAIRVADADDGRVLPGGRARQRPDHSGTGRDRGRNRLEHHPGAAPR
jgi:hypothetical protein